MGDEFDKDAIGQSGWLPNECRPEPFPTLNLTVDFSSAYHPSPTWTNFGFAAAILFTSEWHCIVFLMISYDVTEKKI